MYQTRHDWTAEEAVGVISRPFHDLLADAHHVHRQRFDPHIVEGAVLLSIKTGGCPEDCAYCPQSARWQTGVQPRKLMATDEILTRAREAIQAGATRFCLGAAWRSPTDGQVEKVCQAVRAVGDLGLETCVTLGMITAKQAASLAAAGLR